MISDEKLMLYLDGELSREECRDVERALAEPAVQARVEALTQLRDVIVARTQAVEEEAEPQLAAMWERVRAGLGPAPKPARAPLWGRVREWFEAYRGHMLTGAFAAAAGAILAVLVTGGGGHAIGGAAAQAAQVDDLEVLSGSGTVLHLPDDSGAGTTVVWITPDEQPDETPAETGSGGPI